MVAQKMNPFWQFVTCVYDAVYRAFIEHHVDVTLFCWNAPYIQVTTLDAVPDIEMLIYLPEILDGLLIILGDQNQEIRQTWVTLSER